MYLNLSCILVEINHELINDYMSDLAMCMIPCICLIGKIANMTCSYSLHPLILGIKVAHATKFLQLEHNAKQS